MKIYKNDYSIRNRASFKYHFPVGFLYEFKAWIISRLAEISVRIIAYFASLSKVIRRCDEIFVATWWRASERRLLVADRSRGVETSSKSFDSATMIERARFQGRNNSVLLSMELNSARVIGKTKLMNRAKAVATSRTGKKVPASWDSVYLIAPHVGPSFRPSFAKGKREKKTTKEDGKNGTEEER